MILLYRAPNDREAALLVQALDARGIASQTAGGSAAGAFGELGMESLQVDIHVDEADLERARNVIEREQARAREERESDATWICPSCGETNDPTFDLCWKCQTPRP